MDLHAAQNDLQNLNYTKFDDEKGRVQIDGIGGAYLQERERERERERELLLTISDL